MASTSSSRDLLVELSMVERTVKVFSAPLQAISYPDIDTLPRPATINYNYENLIISYDYYFIQFCYE